MDKLDQIVEDLAKEAKDGVVPRKAIQKLDLEEDSDDYDYVLKQLEGKDLEVEILMDDEEELLDELDDEEAIKMAEAETINTENIDLEKILNIKTESRNANGLKDYLKEIGSSKLLTKQEEVEATLAVAEGFKAEAKLKQFKNGEISLTNEEITDIVEKIGQKKAASDKLVLSNMRLVVAIAKGFYQTSKMELQDLVSEGVFGIYKTIEKFDPTRGLKFSTYATPWIRQSISRAVAEKSRTVRIPVHVHERAIRINKEIAKLNQQNGRMPTVEELSEATGISIPKIVYTKLIAREPVSFESPAGDDESGATISDLISDTSTPSPEQEYERSMIQEYLKDIFTEYLTPLQEKVITLKFGLFNTNQRSLDEIAYDLDMPKTKIKMIEQKAIKVLRTKAIRSKLNEIQ